MIPLPDTGKLPSSQLLTIILPLEPSNIFSWSETLSQIHCYRSHKSIKPIESESKNRYSLAELLALAEKSIGHRWIEALLGPTIADWLTTCTEALMSLLIGL
jgi:hypothetical protein